MTLHMRKATEADLEGIARVGCAAFSRESDAIVRHLFPDRLQPEVKPEGDQVLRWRIARKGIKMKTENILLMVVTDGEQNGEIVGFSMWEVPTEVVGEKQGEYKPVVPCPTLDVDAYGVLRKVTADATKECFGENGSKKLWCKFAPISQHLPSLRGY